MNPFKAVDFKLQGVKCDSPRCDYVDDSAVLSPENAFQHVGDPCPKCGASLLTIEDAQTIVKLSKVVFVINVVAFPFMVLTLPLRLVFRSFSRVGHYHGNMNGTGDIAFPLKEDRK